ncbi:MAG: hypothetical protein ACLS3M_05325 [Collinsella sp.]
MNISAQCSKKVMDEVATAAPTLRTSSRAPWRARISGTSTMQAASPWKSRTRPPRSSRQPSYAEESDGL